MRRPLAVLPLVIALLAPSAAAAAPPPPGANVRCTPTAAHPYPVVLVHGTFENRFDNWQAMSPALKAAGYCVYALDYGARNGSGVVEDLVGLAPSNHGTTNPLAPVAFGCPACRQQVAGSEFLRELNAGDESPGDVSYTQVVTRYDEVVIPYTSGYLAPDANVTNVTLQDVCPNDTSEHLRVPYDPPAIRITLDALGRSGPADPGFRPACTTF